MALSNTNRTPYLYNGKELDEETGLYYYGARYYDPRTSLWQSVDPLAEKYPNLSPYAYVANNPIIAVDPDGRKILIQIFNEDRSAYLSYTYKGGIVYNEDGTEYKGNNKFIRTVQRDLNQLKKDDVKVNEIITNLEKSEREHRIRETNEKGEGYSNEPDDYSAAKKGEGTGSITEYNPNDCYTGGEAKKSQGAGTREPRAGLAHELSHADDYDTGKLYDPESERINNIPIGEIRAVNIENRIRVKTGDAMRNEYGRNTIPARHLEYKQKRPR